jgi:hypothetical protein
VSLTVKTTWNGPKVKAEERKGAARGLYRGAEHVLEQATRLVPLQEGTLERSGVASVDEASMTAAVSYDTPYAVRQHEEMDYQHQRGRQAKYLETPLNASKDEILRLVAEEIRKSLGA